MQDCIYLYKKKKESFLVCCHGYISVKIQLMIFMINILSVCCLQSLNLFPLVSWACLMDLWGKASSQVLHGEHGFKASYLTLSIWAYNFQACAFWLCVLMFNRVLSEILLTCPGKVVVIFWFWWWPCHEQSLICCLMPNGMKNWL